MANVITAAFFIGTLGVNTHLDFGGTYADLAQVESNLEYLGVTNVRDSAQQASDAQLWLQVSQATGVKFDDYIAETSQAGMQTDMSYVTSLANEGVLKAIEGGDEEDDSYPQSLGNTLQATAQVQQQLYALGQQLKLPVINMSFGSGWTAANNWEGDYGSVGDLSAYATYANAHTYPNPGQLPNSAIEQLNGDAKLAAASRPIMTTEIGWSTANANETTIAQYAVDASFDSVTDGDAGLYFYALYDDSSGAWGLFNSDGTPRPAATALHDLTTLLADPGAAAFTPASLNYSLSRTQSTDNSILFQKSNGSDWIGLWNEGGTAHTVTLTLPAAASEIEVYDPITGTSAIQSASNASSVQISLSADPLLIEVVPTAASTGSGGGAGTGTGTGGSGSGSSTSPGGGGTTAPAAGPSDLAVALPGAKAVATGTTTVVTGISISDAWAAGNPGTMTVNVWDDAGDGTVSAPGIAAAARITLTGTVAQINADLASLSFTAAKMGTDGITVNAWNQAGVEVTQTVAVIATAAPVEPTVTIAAGNASPQEMVSNDIITATAGDHTVFIGGTGDTVTLTGGTEKVQAFEGNNSITTGPGNDTISYAGSGNTINAGAGNNVLQDGGTDNTIVMPAAGNGYDDVFGYLLETGDTLDFRAALAATNWNGSASTVGGYLHVSVSGANAVISISATAGGAATPVATLEGAGDVSLATLLAHSTI